MIKLHFFLKNGGVLIEALAARRRQWGAFLAPPNHATNRLAWKSTYNCRHYETVAAVALIAAVLLEVVQYGVSSYASMLLFAKDYYNKHGIGWKLGIFDVLWSISFGHFRFYVEGLNVRFYQDCIVYDSYCRHWIPDGWERVMGDENSLLTQCAKKAIKFWKGSHSPASVHKINFTFTHFHQKTRKGRPEYDTQISTSY